MANRLQKARFIDKQIKDKGYVTTDEIKDEYKCDIKTVRNLIRYMREKWGAHIESKVVSKDPKQYGYVYTVDFREFDLNFDDALLSLLFVKSILKSKDYIPFLTNVYYGYIYIFL